MPPRVDRLCDAGWILGAEAWGKKGVSEEAVTMPSFRRLKRCWSLDGTFSGCCRLQPPRPALLYLCSQCRAKTEAHGERGLGALGLHNIGEFASSTSIVEAVFLVITRSQRMKIVSLFHTGKFCRVSRQWPEGWVSTLCIFRSVRCLPLLCLVHHAGVQLWRLLSAAGFGKLLSIS